jgi:diphthamide biosynthesis enzyme Dph1/Dph2-like protein
MQGQVDHAVQRIRALSKFLGQPGKNVVIQVPCSWLALACYFEQQLAPACRLYLNADPLRNECCTDMAGASHLDFDELIHCGPACFQSFYPGVLFILPHSTLDLPLLTHTLKGLPQPPCLVLDQPFYHYRSAIQEQTKAQVLALPFDAPEGSHYLGYGYYGTKEVEGLVVVSEDDTFRAQFATLPSLKQVTCLDSACQVVEPASFLGRRFALIEKARCCNVIGLLMNGSQPCHRMTAMKLKRLCERLGKKVYLLMMANLTEAKLGNFV